MEFEKPRSIRYILASYHAQANLSGAPVLLVTRRDRRPDGSFLYRIEPHGVHLGISHEEQNKPKKGEKQLHPASALPYYVTFDCVNFCVHFRGKPK